MTKLAAECGAIVAPNITNLLGSADVVQPIEALEKPLEINFLGRLR